MVIAERTSSTVPIEHLNILETSLRRILRTDLGMMPYKLPLVQELRTIHHPMHFCFAKWVCDRLIEDADFGKKKSYFQMKLILILAGMYIRIHNLSLQPFSQDY